jgi:MFS transporter, DHA1 family, solute carrier family 18 (vesicular amine transporter), member 1/2
MKTPAKNKTKALLCDMALFLCCLHQPVVLASLTSGVASSEPVVVVSVVASSLVHTQQQQQQVPRRRNKREEQNGKCHSGSSRLVVDPDSAEKRCRYDEQQQQQQQQQQGCRGQRSSTLKTIKRASQKSTLLPENDNIREEEERTVIISKQVLSKRGGAAAATAAATSGGPRVGGGKKMKRDNNSTRSNKMVLALVAMALLNDSLQVTMLAPIVHTLVVNSPPPLGVTSNGEIALGLFFAAKDICQLLFAPVAGILTARLQSPILTLSLSTAALGMATLVFAEATTFRQLLLARGAQGAASAAVLTGGLSLIAQTHDPAVRGAAMGVANAGLALGLVCGPLLGGALFEAVGRRQTFRHAGCVVLANAVAQALLLPRAVAAAAAAKTTMGRSKIYAANTMKADRRATTNASWSSFRKLLGNRDVLAVAGAILAAHAVIGCYKPMVQMISDREFGLGVFHRSLVISIATITFFITTPIAGRISDRIPRRSRLVSVGLLLTVLTVFFFSIRSYCGFWALCVSVACLGASMGVSGSASQALLADLVDRHELGEYGLAFALADMADSIGLIAGPIVGLTISQLLGSPSAGLCVVASLCLLLLPAVMRIP